MVNIYKKNKKDGIIDSILDAYTNKIDKNYDIEEQIFLVSTQKAKLESTFNDKQLNIFNKLCSSEDKLKILKFRELIEYTIDFIKDNEQ